MEIEIASPRAEKRYLSGRVEVRSLQVMTAKVYRASEAIMLSFMPLFAMGRLRRRRETLLYVVVADDHLAQSVNVAIMPAAAMAGLLLRYNLPHSLVESINILVSNAEADRQQVDGTPADRSPRKARKAPPTPAEAVAGHQQQDTAQHRCCRRHGH
jgi:hypothetical protein